MEIITSLANNRIKRIVLLKDDKKARRKECVYIAEGINTVKDMDEPLEVYATEDIDLASFNFKCPEYIVDGKCFSKISGTVTPQGILAVYAIPDVSVRAPEGGRAVILDGINDPGNMGTIIRTAAATGFNDVYIINGADPYSPKCVRASMSGISRVNIYEGNAEETVKAVKNKGLTVCALDINGENFFEFDAQKTKLNIKVERIALVIGSEAHGISDIMKENADKMLSLPMENIESLNAGVAAGIAMYHFWRKK